MDVALYCNGANAIFTWLPRLCGMPVALNVDGIERLRKKWNRLAKAWYLVSEWLATFCPTEVVTDARTIQDYYRTRYGKASTFIPYGAEVGKVAGDRNAGELGPGTRPLLPVREPHGTGEPSARSAAGVRARGERRSSWRWSAMRLMRRTTFAQVRDTRDARVVIPGAIYGDGYRELGSHCFAYIHATEVGGTHPALIEAMGRGALVLYRNTPENAEVAGDAGIPFEPAELASKLRMVVALTEAERAEYRARAMERVRKRYSWDAVTDAYEKLLGRLGRKRGEDDL